MTVSLTIVILCSVFVTTSGADAVLVKLLPSTLSTVGGGAMVSAAAARRGFPERVRITS